MDFQEYCKNKVRKKIDDPKKALALIRLGLTFYQKRISILPDKRVGASLRYLNKVMVSFFHQPLKKPQNSALINLFIPTEILHAFGVHPLFGEAFSACLRELDLEDKYMDIAESAGASESMCSYHRTLYGAAQAELLPKLKFIVATSMICDNNINICRNIARKYNLPFYAIDVPYSETDESVYYLAGQLKDFIKMVEDTMHKKFKINKLKKILRRENQTIDFMNLFNDELANKVFPNSLGLEMSKMIVSYIFIGSKEANNFYKKALRDIKKSPQIPRGTKKILWINILPSHHKVLDKFFSFSNKYQLIGSDFNLYRREKLNAEKPLESIARKMIRCIYNGTGDKKVKEILRLIQTHKPDAVIHFNHWGCKQANGGVGLIKEVAMSENVPFLALDGDAVDQRNSHDGQVRTRVGAFLEMLDKKPSSR